MPSTKIARALSFFAVRVVVEDAFGSARMDFIRPEGSDMTRDQWTKYAVGYMMLTKFAPHGEQALTLDGSHVIHVLELDRFGNVKRDPEDYVLTEVED